MADQHHLAALGLVAQAVLVDRRPAGRWRRSPTGRGRRPRPAPSGRTPWAEEDGDAAGRHLASSSTNTAPSAAVARRHGGCGRSCGGRRSGAPNRSAPLDVSMARSTPAQNDRGRPAGRLLGADRGGPRPPRAGRADGPKGGPAASPPLARLGRKAPARPVGYGPQDRQWPGHRRRAAAVDSMSTATAPKAASSARAARPRTGPFAVTIGSDADHGAGRARRPGVRRATSRPAPRAAGRPADAVGSSSRSATTRARARSRLPRPAGHPPARRPRPGRVRVRRRRAQLFERRPVSRPGPCRGTARSADGAGADVAHQGQRLDPLAGARMSSCRPPPAEVIARSRPLMVSRPASALAPCGAAAGASTYRQGT